jgi:hypothetical protein
MAAQKSSKRRQPVVGAMSVVRKIEPLRVKFLELKQTLICDECQMVEIAASAQLSTV